MDPDTGHNTLGAKTTGIPASSHGARLSDLEHQLAELEAAAKRLDEGTYGLCEVCGAQIDEERLEALPLTRYCLADDTI